MLLALPVLGLVGVTFASMALVFNALAKGYDFFTYYFTLVDHADDLPVGRVLSDGADAAAGCRRSAACCR